MPMRVHIQAMPVRRSNSAGFSLVELMVTLVIFALVATAITVVLLTSARGKQGTDGRIESAQTARAALDLIARDIRCAGYGTDQDFGTPQPAITYVSSSEIIVAENQAPYPDGVAGPNVPLAYAPTGNPKPFPIDGTAYAPPIRYRTGAELIRYTLDVNNDGAVDASDISSTIGRDAQGTPNPNDYVLVRQTYGDSTGLVAGNNGGSAERVALIRRPGDTGVPALFTVYMRGASTPWDWANGPVPVAELANIQRVVLNVTAAASRPDSRGQFPQTTLKSEVNATRSVPDFGVTTYAISGYVFNSVNHSMTKGSNPGLAGASVRAGNYMGYTTSTGFYSLHVPAGNFTLSHTPPMGYGSFASPDTFNVTVSNAAITRDFPDTARAGGSVTMRAFNDLNGNGVWDTGESALRNIQFTVAPGSPGAGSGFTDVNGSLVLFTGVGGYTVTCNKPDSLALSSSTPSPVSGTMSNGGTASHSFGLSVQIVGHVTGRVFVDSNRDGLLGGSEVGLANVWVGVSKDGGLNVAGYAYTDATGNYNISVPINDPPHTEAYSAYSIPPPGYFPTGSSSIGSLWVVASATVANNNFGMANFQIIRLTASRVLSLLAADVIEADWKANKTAEGHADQDLILGADAGGTDNVSVWFNQYAGSPLFGTTPSGSDGYTRLAPNSVLSMAADTLDKNNTKARPDLVTGTRYTASGNFFVWFTQGTSNNEGFLPTTYNSGRNFKTLDNGDVQSVLTLDCGGGAMPDLIVGTKGATAGQGSIEVWLNSDATTPTFTRDQTITTAGASILGEVTGMALADMDNDGDKDLIVVTRTSDYRGQVLVYENTGRTAGNHLSLRFKDTLNSDSPTSVAVFDGDGDGWRDVFVGTQISVTQGHVIQYKSRGPSPAFSWLSLRTIDAPGIVMSLNGADFGGNVIRKDLAVGYRGSTSDYTGGVRIYFMDLGLLPLSGTDPSAGSVFNMVPALTSANFNYGLNTTTPPSPYLTDLAAGLKASATTGALVVFIR